MRKTKINMDKDHTSGMGRILIGENELIKSLKNPITDFQLTRVPINHFNARINILTCHHGRSDVVELFYLGVERLKQTLNVQVYCAITKGDTDNINLANKYGAKHIEYQNKPLGAKWNQAFRFMYSDTNGVGLCCIMGDDDLISSDLLTTLADIALNDKVVSGTQRIAFYDTTQHKAIQFDYDKPFRFIGCGRVFDLDHVKPKQLCKIARPRTVGKFTLNGQMIPMDAQLAKKSELKQEVITKPSWSFHSLWEDKINSGLDASSDFFLSVMYGMDYHCVDTDDIHLIDVKAGNNITPMQGITNKRTAKEIDANEALWFLSDEELDYFATHLWRKDF